MANMTVRSSYALDPETARIIKRLARNSGISQAEVIRRSVRLAAEHEAAPRLSVAEAIARYAQRPLPRDRVQTRRLIESMRALRHEDDARRSGGAVD